MSTALPVTSSNSTTWVPPANGIVGGYTGANVHINRAMMAFAAIAWYNSIELIFLILVRFKHYKGLYFWSLMVTAWAIIIYMIGAWGKMVNIAAQTIITQTFCNIGWICMVTGNSLVLYSRLHLITQNYRLLRWIIWIIIINAILMYIPTTTLDYGCNVNPWSPGYCNGYSIMERIQMTLFSIQEFAISGMYLLEAHRYLKLASRDLQTKYILYELVAVNVALIALDVALLSVEYEDLYQIEVTLKGFVYSLKLKLELGVLSRLVKIVSRKGKTATFGVYKNKSGEVEPEHVEALSPSSSNPRTSSTLPWLARISSWHSQQPQTPVAPAPSSLEFVTTAELGKPNPTLNSGRVYRLPSNAEIEQVREQLTIPPPSAQRNANGELSRQSSISDYYPGRITGG